MTEKDLVNEGKGERQKTMDKLSIERGKAYTYETDEGSGCPQGRLGSGETEVRKGRRQMETQIGECE